MASKNNDFPLGARNAPPKKTLFFKIRDAVGGLCPGSNPPRGFENPTNYLLIANLRKIFFENAVGCFWKFH